MPKKGIRLGRRALNKRIAKLEAGASESSALESKLDAMRRLFAKANDGERRAIDQAAREKERAASITDIIGGFKLYLIKPDAIPQMRFQSYRLQMDIMPDLYAMSFDRGGSYDRDFRNFSLYCRMIGDDISRKVEKMLVENRDKLMSGNPVGAW